MMKSICLLAIPLLAASGCGGEASGSQESEHKVLEVEQATTNTTETTKVWRGGEMSDAPHDDTSEPMESAPRDPEPASTADATETESSTASPDLLGNHLWVAGEANLLTDEKEKELSTGFKWVEQAPQTTQSIQEEKSSVEDEVTALREEQAKILEEMKALREQAEQDRLAALAEAEAMRKQVEEENALARVETQKELDQLAAEAEAERLAAAEQAAEMRKQAEQENALAKAETQKELERMKAKAEAERRAALAQAEAVRVKAEQEKAVAEAARAKAEQEKAATDAKMAKQAGLERKASEAEKQRLAAVAKAETARSEKEARELEHARAQAKADRLEAEMNAQKKDASPETVVASKPKPTLSAAKGSIKMAKLNSGVKRDGIYGIELVGDGTVENLKGQKIELAAYFYDAQGKPLKDTDKINRSSKGQVYVGKETTADSKDYKLDGKLFIPFDQLEVQGDTEQTVQVELVVWEYSHGRGKKLAATPKTKFQHTPTAARDALLAARRDDLSGSWRQGDTVITIVHKDGNVVINGLGVVPYTILSEQWAYERGRLEGTVINKRKVPPMTRIWNFDLRISDDGNTLSGTFHRADKKGNFGFDSEPFVWTRVN